MRSAQRSREIVNKKEEKDEKCQVFFAMKPECDLRIVVMLEWLSGCCPSPGGQPMGAPWRACDCDPWLSVGGGPGRAPEELGSFQSG